MRALQFSVIAAASTLLILGSMASGCGDDPAPGTTVDGSVTDSPGPRPDQDNPQSDSGSDARVDADGGPLKFSDYVKDLVNNQTSDMRAPDTRVNDPFIDDEDPTAYPPAFFP
jgi:hypothetical protein